MGAGSPRAQVVDSQGFTNIAKNFHRIGKYLTIRIL